MGILACTKGPPPLPPRSLLLHLPTRSTTGSLGSAERAARVTRWRRPQRRNERHITGTHRTRNTRNTHTTRGRITYRCNTQHALYNLCVLKPSIRLGAAILDFRGIAQLPFLRLNLQAVGGVSSLLKMETGDCHSATIQNNMARVMHGYLICGHVGEEHLILSAILAADLFAVHPGCVPPSCEDMCGTAPEAETKRRNEHNRGCRHHTACPNQPNTQRITQAAKQPNLPSNQHTIQQTRQATLSRDTPPHHTRPHHMTLCCSLLWCVICFGL